MTNGTRFLAYAGGDVVFAQWLAQVDSVAVASVGVGIEDLPDYLWRDAYDAGDDARIAWLDAVAWGILE